MFSSRGTSRLTSLNLDTHRRVSGSVFAHTGEGFLYVCYVYIVAWSDFDLYCGLVHDNKNNGRPRRGGRPLFLRVPSVSYWLP